MITPPDSDEALLLGVVEKGRGFARVLVPKIELHRVAHKRRYQGRWKELPQQGLCRPPRDGVAEDSREDPEKPLHDPKHLRPSHTIKSPFVSLRRRSSCW